MSVKELDGDGANVRDLRGQHLQLADGAKLARVGFERLAGLEGEEEGRGELECSGGPIEGKRRSSIILLQDWVVVLDFSPLPHLSSLFWPLLFSPPLLLSFSSLSPPFLSLFPP